MIYRSSNDNRMYLANKNYLGAINDRRPKADLLIVDLMHQEEVDFITLIRTLSAKLDTRGSALIFSTLPNIATLSEQAEHYNYYVHGVMTWKWSNVSIMNGKDRQYILWISKSTMPYCNLMPNEYLSPTMLQYAPLPSVDESCLSRKPALLMEELIDRYSKPQAIVRDLFADYSVFEVCRKLDRSYHGFTKDVQVFKTFELY
ncbi:hypothetical protein BN997_00523 [Oceanobacillus oncorhynchi]|uniref:DNA methylase N-4/N-6 domain-containing protein n=1 Tax=Oceanobacillus oncorhynchi TaxID=545501 RepID=A0A0A1MLL1_9BACI|nr:DNA methyltransferase [Oceanobacillus oncorhynchi]CEI80714.1 hypothetical protein BN997_00523 [Oceanobacillus oncorhynchi]